ncbi:hypothetical protein [Salinibacterium sp. ZJ454]|uniref:hypothetical protein n=1 Tax=Salinibacterium sp. ZJ454 TaxID=2708339 RepID=UPI001423FCF5|nr:hypothetical protein [Salinibacterium sp. ZJ454]
MQSEQRASQRSAITKRFGYWLLAAGTLLFLLTTLATQFVIYRLENDLCRFAVTPPGTIESEANVADIERVFFPVGVRCTWEGTDGPVATAVFDPAHSAALALAIAALLTGLALLAAATLRRNGKNPGQIKQFHRP